MYMPLYGISINAVTPDKQANFVKIWRVTTTALEILKLMVKTKESLVNYVNEAFFIQPESLEIFFALQKCLFNG